MILVMGCGFLGSCIVKNLIDSAQGGKVIAAYRNEANIPDIPGAEFIRCDVTDINDLKNLKEKCGSEPLKVVYLSAVHNIDYVYKNPLDAARTNIDALGNFLDVNNNIERIIFASTDCVYGDIPAPFHFKETDETNPVNEYGRQKLRAEKIITEHGGTAVRLPLMIGPTPSPKKGFFDNCSEKLEIGQKIDMLDGYLRSALTFNDAAYCICRLLLKDGAIPPIINVCGDEDLSKYEIGCRLADYLGVSKELVNYLPEEKGDVFYKEKRAKSALMDNSLIKSVLTLEKIPFSFG